jgi:SAM-dependent methyltransferase
MPAGKDDVEAFAADAASNQGYLYTTNARISSQLANRRLTDAVLAVGDFRGRRVLDLGCGDGTYTHELAEAGQVAAIHGMDPAEEAVKVAKAKAGAGNVSFGVGSAYTLPYRDDSFDVAVLRGVLHHMGQPIEAIREGLRVAPTLVVVEPNGYNPALKVLERCSSYHIEHGEKSYAPATLDRWVAGVGGTVRQRLFAGFVPMFCPDWMARVTKLVEPAVEAVPLVRHIGCAVYVFRAERAGAGLH